MKEAGVSAVNPMPGRIFTSVFMALGLVVGAVFAIPIAALWAKFVARAS